MAELPTGWTMRRPTMDDVEAILAVVHACDIAAIGYPDFTTDEVVEILQAPNHDPSLDSWLVHDDLGELVAWACIENPTRGPREHFELYADPARGLPAHAYLLDQVLARSVERARESGHDDAILRGGAIASETELIGLLKQNGFQFIKRYARMRRDLSEVELAPDVPNDITVRPVRPDDEAELRAFHAVIDTAFRDVPDHQPADFETFRSRLAALPGVDWDEWFVAEVDGVIVGALMSSRQGVELNEGWVKNLGVAKELRSRGLGRLLLLTAFAVYAAKGRTAAGLGVDMTNPTGAYRLYESVGMSPAYEADVYERPISG